MNTQPIEKTAEQAATQPDHDPDHPVADPHASHDWILGARFAECATCAARDHWPAARLACVKAPSGRALAITLAGALRLLYLDLDAFAVWWQGRPDLGDTRPTLNEWAAEFLEWRLNRA